MTDTATLDAALAAHGLMVAGIARETDHDIALIAPDEPGLWTHIRQSPEWADGLPDPVDRWSKRVLGAFARDHDCGAVFPSDGPPYPPFYSWAVATGRVWASPVSFLVHDRAGLFVSFRGALILPFRAVIQPSQNPCAPCPKPCLTACPVGALTEKGYDVPACHAFLGTKDGADCLDGGCLVRRACPVGRGRRPADQSAYHMRQFHP